jgi:hypothetical protein
VVWTKLARIHLFAFLDALLDVRRFYYVYKGIYRLLVVWKVGGGGDDVSKFLYIIDAICLLVKRLVLGSSFL